MKHIDWKKNILKQKTYTNSLENSIKSKHQRKVLKQFAKSLEDYEYLYLKLTNK